MSTDTIERHFTATAYIVTGGRTLLLWHRKLGMWLPPGRASGTERGPGTGGRARGPRGERPRGRGRSCRQACYASTGRATCPPPAVIGVFDIDIERAAVPPAHRLRLLHAPARARRLRRADPAGYPPLGHRRGTRRRVFPALARWYARASGGGRAAPRRSSHRRSLAAGVTPVCSASSSSARTPTA